MVDLALARQAPEDLGVNLDQFQRPELAAEFFMQLDNLFAVFSPSVKKLYSKYEAAVLPGKMVVVPDFADYNAIYSHISADAVSPTSVIVFPGAAHQRQGIYMAGKNKQGKMMASPLHVGIQKILGGQYLDGAFLPVVLMKDLQQLPNKPHPCVRLHNLDLSKLMSRSAFERKHIGSLIQKNCFSELAKLKKKGVA